MGKLGDCVVPATYELPLASTAMPAAISLLLPAEEGRELHARIDHELVAALVAADGEREAWRLPRGVEPVAARHGHALAGDGLVGDRPRVPKDAQGGLDPQRAVGIERQTLGTGVGEADVRDPPARPHVELVLQDPRPLVQAQVDLRPEVAVDDLAVAGEPGPVVGRGSDRRGS